jgi:spore coat polysaccharide biosynthesis protein SpsF
MTGRLVGVIQARMGSTRLPAKVLEPLTGDGAAGSVLGWTVRAARESGCLDDVVIATTTGPEDDALVAAGAELGVDVVRGPVEDVLTRFLMAIDGRDAAHVMRLTADCPLLDPAVLAVVGAAVRSGSVDYVSTGTPRTLPRGLDCEAFPSATLHRLDEVATDYHRTHVTSYAYTHPDEFRCAGITFAPAAAHLRVTVDTPEDLALVRAVVEGLGDGPHPWRSVVDLLDSRPDIVALNAAIEQKALAEG